MITNPEVLEEKADGRSLANVRVNVVTEEGNIGRGSSPIQIPGFSGDVPGIDAIDVDTTRPGPDERVSFAVRPESDTGYGGLESIDVYGPGGELIDSEITDSGRVTFHTQGKGVHFVRVTYTNTGGDTFALSFRLDAAETSASTNPTVRVGEYAGGLFGIAGNGLDSAAVDKSEGVLEISPIALGDESLPGHIDIKPGKHLTRTTDETARKSRVLHSETTICNGLMVPADRLSATTTCN